MLPGGARSGWLRSALHVLGRSSGAGRSRISYPRPEVIRRPDHVSVEASSLPATCVVAPRWSLMRHPGADRALPQQARPDARRDRLASSRPRRRAVRRRLHSVAPSPAGERSPGAAGPGARRGPGAQRAADGRARTRSGQGCRCAAQIEEGRATGGAASAQVTRRRREKSITPRPLPRLLVYLDYDEISRTLAGRASAW